MSRFSIVQERVPLVWILVGLLFNAAGLYLGFEFGLTFGTAIVVMEWKRPGQWCPAA